MLRQLLQQCHLLCWVAFNLHMYVQHTQTEMKNTATDYQTNSSTVSIICCKLLLSLDSN